MSADLPAWEDDEYIETTWGELIELKYGKGLKGYKGAVGEFQVYGTNGPVGFCDKALCNFPGVVIGRKGAYRGVHYSDRPFYVIDTAYFVVPKYNINLKWAYYSLLSQDINGLDSGSAIPSTRRDDFYAMPAKVPPRIEQDKIVEKLDCLNSKIQLNRQTNQTLEHIAQAIFKSWFVDFEPTRAKIKAKKHWQAAQQNIKASSVSDYAEPSDKQHQHTTSLQEAMNRAAMAAISGKTEAELNNLPADTLQQLRTTAELFPDTLVESELGEIPAGWEVKTLDKKVKPKKGRNITKATIKTGTVPVVAGGLKPAYFHSNHNVTASVITISASGANAGFVALYHENIWASDCSSVNKEQTEYIYSIYLFFKNRQGEITKMQQGAAQPHVYPKDLCRLKLVDPSDGIWKKLEFIVAPLFEFIKSNKEEVVNLTETRDTLLPKLLSGELSATV